MHLVAKMHMRMRIEIRAYSGLRHKQRACSNQWISSRVTNEHHVGLLTMRSCAADQSESYRSTDQSDTNTQQRLTNHSHCSTGIKSVVQGYPVSRSIPDIVRKWCRILILICTPLQLGFFSLITSVTNINCYHLLS